MRASRLLSILMVLQTRGRVTAEALAAEFEVSVRTIYRDIEQLSAADVPVYADRGPNGGFQLLDGYRTKLTGLSPAEAETLFLAGLPGPAAELGIADVLTTAQLKLTAALPERARATANRVAARFHLDPVGWFRSAGEAQLLPAIAHAVWDERCLDVRYQGRTGTAIHKLQPLGLVLKAGIWYLVAGGSDRPRTYRVSNILEITVRDERFERPKDFDLDSHMRFAHVAVLKLACDCLADFECGHTARRHRPDERHGDPAARIDRVGIAQAFLPEHHDAQAVTGIEHVGAGRIRRGHKRRAAHAAAEHQAGKQSDEYESRPHEPNPRPQ